MTPHPLCPGCAETVTLIGRLETLTDANAFDPATAIHTLPQLLESALSSLLSDFAIAEDATGNTAQGIRLLRAAAAQAQGLHASMENTRRPATE